MGKGKTILNQAKKDLKSKYFLVAILCALIMGLICFVGNPRIGNMPAHYIPEMAAFYCLGLWACTVKWTWKTVLTWYVFTVFSTQVLVAPLNLIFIITLPIPAMLGAPMLLAYWQMKRDEKKVLGVTTK